MHIKLNELSDVDVARLQASCSSFHLSYSKTKTFNNQVSFLKEMYGNKYNNELWLIITAFVRTKRIGNNCSKFSLNKNHYTKARKEGFKFSYTKIKKLLEEMELDGYTVLYKGDVGSPSKERRTSILEFTQKFQDIFCTDTIKREIPLLNDVDLVEIRDEFTKELVNFSKVRGIKSIRDELIEYNKVLDNTEIKLLGVDCGVVYKRVFTNNLKSAGRYYGGCFQTIKSKYRGTILFDGEQTIELDVSSIHPSIIACKENIKLPDDFLPYNCYSNFKGDGVELRRLFKQAVMCMLYSSTEREAKAALYNHYCINKEDYKSVYLGKGDINKILYEVKNHNSYMVSHLYDKDLWKELQYLDSSICRVVINNFVALNKPILSYHDSWVVSESDVTILVAFIESAWREILGTTDNLVLK